MKTEPSGKHQTPKVSFGSTQAELVVGSTLFLMSSYARGGHNQQLQKIILRHLEDLADREDFSAVLRKLCDELAIEWHVSEPGAAQLLSDSQSKATTQFKKRAWLRLV